MSLCQFNDASLPNNCYMECKTQKPERRASTSSRISVFEPWKKEIIIENLRRICITIISERSKQMAKNHCNEIATMNQSNVALTHGKQSGPAKLGHPRLPAYAIVELTAQRRNAILTLSILYHLSVSCFVWWSAVSSLCLFLLFLRKQ